MKAKQTNKIIFWKCPYCDKKMTSLYKAQMDYNTKMHLANCKKKRKKDGTKKKGLS